MTWRAAAERGITTLLQLFLLTHCQAELMSGRAALLLPVANSQGYLHQWGTWSTSGYHCPEQKSAAEENRHKNSRLSREEGLTLNAQCNTATDGDNNWCRGC